MANPYLNENLFDDLTVDEPNAFEQIGKDTYAGYQAGGSGVYKLLGNATNLVNDFNDWLVEKTDIGHPAGRGLEDWFYQARENMQPDYYPTTTVGKINAGLGSVPAAIAQYGAFGKLLGPVLGFGTADAISESDKGLLEAGKAGLKGAAMGKYFEAAAPLSVPFRTAALGTMGGGVAAAEGGDASDVVSGTVTMGTLGMMNPGGPVKAREAVRQNVVDPTVKVAKAAWNPGSQHTSKLENKLPEGELEINKRPVTREDIMIPLLEAMDVPMYIGRTKKHKASGIYKPTSEEVRIDKRGNYETAVHELGHFIDDTVFAGFHGKGNRPWLKGPKARTYQKELNELSYDKSKTYEGFAEYLRNWVTQPEVARTAAPEFSRWFDDFVETNQHGPALKAARERAMKWQEQSALTRMNTKIGAQEPLNDVRVKLSDEIRQSLFDDLHGFNIQETTISGGIKPEGLYQTARTSRGAYPMLEGALTIGAPIVKPDGSHGFKGKSLQDVLTPVMGAYDKFALYAVGRSAAELKGQGRENLFSRAEIAASQKLETPEFKKAFEDYQAWNKSVVDFAQAKGLINPATRKLWNRTQYLPFFRVSQGGQTKRSQGIEGLVKATKRLTGGDANLKDVMGNMIQNSAHLMTEALKNEVRLKSIDLAKKRGGAKFLAKISPDVLPQSVEKGQIENFTYKLLGIDPALAKKGIFESEAQQKAFESLKDQFSKHPEFLNFWQYGQAPTVEDQNIIAALRNGKPEYYEVADPVLYRAFEALNRPAKHWLVDIASMPKRVGQTTITLTPDFLAANFLRDTLTASILSKHGFIPLLDSIRGMKSRIIQDQNYQDFIANGGGFSSYYVNEKAYKSHLERLFNSKGIDTKTILDFPKNGFFFAERIGDAVEMSARLGEFKKAIKAGVNPRTAAFEAREVSTDFAMRGDNQAVGFLYDTALFLKAGVNGIDRIYRGFTKDSNRGAIAAKAGTLALASAALYSLNRGNPLYEQMEDWNKDSNWHFFIPTEGYYDFVEENGREPQTPEEAEGAYEHWRLPKIWEIGAMSSIAERTMEELYNSDSEWGKATGKILMDQFKLEYMPQIVAPLYETYGLNRNRFTQRPIETQAMEQMEPFARRYATGSKALEELGLATRNLPRSLQISPAKAESLLKGYFNTWAMYGLDALDSFSENRTTKRADELPVARRFYQQQPARNTKYGTMYYDLMKELGQVRRTMRHFDETGRTDIADEREQTLIDAPIDLDSLNYANKELQGISKEIRAVRRDKSLSPEEKKERIKDLIRERNLIQREAVTR